MKRMIKRLALLVTLVFSLQILSPLAKALALEPEPAPAAGSGAAARADAPVIAFDEQLAALQQALDEYEAAANDLRRNEAMARVRTLRQSLRDLDGQVRALWADTELKLGSAKAQGEISNRPLERHQAMVQQYQAAVDLLESQLDALESMHGGNQAGAKGAAKGLRDRLNDLDHKRVDKELGSGTLPYRPSQVPGREPVLGDSLIPAYDYGRQAVDQGIKGASPAGSLTPSADDLAAAGEVEITPEIEDLAEMLGNNPVRIYEWVRNNIAYEPYFGTVKGAMQTLREMAGNDADQAALLIAILRAAGIPARYVRGAVDIPGAQAANWVGVSNPRTAASVFATGGVPVSALIGGGTVAGVRIEHVWVEAYVPYGSYRGAVAGSLSPTWVALDPSFKQYDDTPAVNLSQQAGMSADDFLTDLMAAATVNEAEDQILAVDRDAVLALLAQRLEQQVEYLESSGQQDMPVSAITRQRTIRAEQLELLPASLPYQVQAVLGEYTRQPDAQHQRLRITLDSLSYEAPIYQLAGKRLTLTYIPATPEDEAVAARYGGLYNTPAYLVDVRAQLKLDGQIVAEGTAVNMGYQQNLAMDFIQPGNGYSERVDNLVTAGAFYAIVLNLQKVPERLLAERQAKLKASVNAGLSATSEAVLGETLYITGLTYFLEVGKYSDYLADTGNITYYSQVSEGMTGLDLKVSSLFGAPYSARPGGMYIDVDRNIVSPFALDGDEHKVLSWMFLSGMASSAMEHEIFKQLYGAPAISAMKYLQEAAEEEIPIFTITADNAATLIPQLRVSSYVRSAVWDAIASGREVIIPQEAMRIYDWQGVGYIVLDPDTGSAGYMIAGGWAGGSWLLDIDFDDLPRFIQGLLAFLNGLILGDFDWDGYDDPMLEKLRLLGQILSGLVAVGDIRDALAAAYRIYETGGAEGKLALVLSLIGIIPGLGDLIKTGKFAPEMIEAFTQQALKNIPPNQLDQATDALRRAFGEGADDAIAKLAKQYDISDITSNGSDVFLKGSKYGTDLDMHMIGNGDDFIRRMGLDPSDASTANKGLIGEHAADYLAQKKGWDTPDGFRPPTEGQHGIDRVYRDQNGNLVVVESKFTSSDGNVGKNILGSTQNGQQMSNEWIENAINEMVDLGNLSPALANELRTALANGTLRKELVVVQDTVSNGSTATKGLMSDTGLNGVTIINTGGVVGP